MLFIIYVFYTVPLTFIQSLLDPDASPIPGYAEFVSSIGFYGRLLVTLLPGLCFTLFYSLCPVMFKTIANFGSNATSQFAAECAAMKVSTPTLLVLLSLNSCLQLRNEVFLVVL